METESGETSLWVHQYERKPSLTSSHVIHVIPFINIKLGWKKYLNFFKTINLQVVGSNNFHSHQAVWGWLTGCQPGFMCSVTCSFLCQKCFGSQILWCNSWEVRTEHGCFCLLRTFCSSGKSR